MEPMFFGIWGISTPFALRALEGDHADHDREEQADPRRPVARVAVCQEGDHGKYQQQQREPRRDESRGQRAERNLEVERSCQLPGEQQNAEQRCDHADPGPLRATGRVSECRHLLPVEEREDHVEHCSAEHDLYVAGELHQRIHGCPMPFPCRCLQDPRSQAGDTSIEPKSAGVMAKSQQRSGLVRAGKGAIPQFARGRVPRRRAQVPRKSRIALDQEAESARSRNGK